MPIRRTTTRLAATTPAPDTTATEVVIPPDTEAEVTEQIGAKTVSYKATVVGTKKEEDENNDDEMESEDFADETYLPRSFARSERQTEAIPKDKLTQLFDILNDEYRNEPFFFAHIVRQPDALGDRFAVPCNTEMPLGVFQFGLSDRFNFLPELQRLSGSGGRYNVLIFSSEQKPLDAFVSFSYERGQRRPITQQLGVRNLLVPNPPPKPEEPQQQSDLGRILAQFAETQQAQTRMILEAIQRANQRPEKSTLENAIEQKILNDLLNPPKPQSNEFERQLATLLTMPAMAEGLARKMFPTEPPSEPQSLVDRVLGNTEVVNKLIDTGGNIVGNLAQLAAMKMQADAQSQPPQPPQPPQPIQPQPIQIPDSTENDLMIEQAELVNEILVELETNNPINADNAKLKELSNKFPKIYPLLKTLAKTTQFPELLESLESIVDFGEHGLLDEDGDFNPRGLAVKARLREFYDFLQKQP